jgi:hypothetical protein
MTCPNCGYVMSSFDKACPRCKEIEKRQALVPPLQTPPSAPPLPINPPPAPTRIRASKQEGKAVECYLCGSVISPDEPHYRRYVLKGFARGTHSSSGTHSSLGTSFSFGKKIRFSIRSGSSHRSGSSRRENYSLQTVCGQCALRMRHEQLQSFGTKGGVLGAILGFLLFRWTGAVLGFIAGFAVVYMVFSIQPISPGPKP